MPISPYLRKAFDRPRHPASPLGGRAAIPGGLVGGSDSGPVCECVLKKRDYVTRVAGVILEKRVNSHQEILAFFEDATHTLQVPSDRASPVHELIQSYGLEAPWGANPQYGEIFESVEKFHGFQRQLEKLISQHKLWLDAKVGFHLNLILAYFVGPEKSATL